MSDHETAACLLIRSPSSVVRGPWSVVGKTTAPGKPKSLAGTSGRLVYDSRRDALRDHGPRTTDH
jgi:hypothetical protein